jgi:hypothetical protein
VVEWIQLNGFTEELDRLLVVTSREGGIALCLQCMSQLHASGGVGASRCCYCQKCPTVLGSSAVL